ncbi:MAG: aldehyde dehydrogenase family protein [Bacteroidetes bacterium]|nr:aldehyde dehydrogenase family protein [Bacteroidota bacterium]
MPTKNKSTRLSVLKTYKLYIGGQFPRTESGRYYVVNDASGNPLANACLSSRKDLRDAVSAARSAFGGWSGRAAYNRGQILYRMAEVLESRQTEMIRELQQRGASASQAKKEITACIETLIHYAGWCDKFQQLFSSVNPVASSHYNFSVPEPMGVVGIISSSENALLGLVQAMCGVIAGGNTCVIVANTDNPLAAIDFAEVLATSDLPGGVVNILTGNVSELLPWMASHMDINAVLYDPDVKLDREALAQTATGNLKRVIKFNKKDVLSPYRILDLQEIKTTWHPIENIAPSGAAY